MYDNYDEHFKFIVRDETLNYKNVQYINPLKQRDVLDIIKCYSQCDTVQAIIIFGSSVQMECSSVSDIDVYLELSSGNLPNSYPECDSDVDVLYSTLVKSTSLLNEIQRKGIEVWRR